MDFLFITFITIFLENATNIPYQQKDTIFTLITNSKKNWYEAFADCRRRGLDLASIENEEEYQNIYRQIIDRDGTTRLMSFWLSATDLIHENKYVWMSSGHNVGIANWVPGEPKKYSRRGEHCVELQYQENHKMNSNSCKNTKNYICESRNNENPKLSEQRSKTFTVFTGNKLNWYEALVDCKRRGLRLATVENYKEEQELVRLIKSRALPTGEVVFWLSGSDLGSVNNYVWMTSGQPLTFTAWHSDKEPNHYVIYGEMEHCLTLSSYYGYKWNDLVCSKRNYYVCDNQA